LLKALRAFAPASQKSLRDQVFRRLGLQPKDLHKDIDFVLSTFRLLEETQVSWPQFWHDWQGGAPSDMSAYGEAFLNWNKAYTAYTTIGGVAKADKPASLIYEEIGALWAPIAEQDDWSAFKAKLQTYQRAAF